VVDDQGFNWESAKKGGWYNLLKQSAAELATSGITHVWLPPPSHSNASEGIFVTFPKLSFVLNLLPLSSQNLVKLNCSYTR
jgi:hypothetical protein